MPFLNIETKVDHPDKLQQVAGIPSKYFIESEEFNKTVEAINELDGRLIASSTDKILVNNGFSIVGTNFIFNALSKWLISGITKINPAIIQKPIVLAAAGLRRQDVVVLNANNDIEILKGPEVEVFTTKPSIPDNVIVLTDYPVTDSTIGTPSLPVIGETFVKKIAFGEIIFSGSGVTAMMMDAEVGGLRFQGTNAIFESVFCYNEAALFNGKPFFLKNSQLNSMTIKHMVGLGYKFSFPDGNDFLMKPGQIAPFEWTFNINNVWVLEYIGVLNQSIPELTTTDVREGSRLYFLPARVLNTILSTISFVSSAPVTAFDSVISGFGKLQAQCNALFTAVSLRELLSNKSNGPLGDSTEKFPTEHSVKTYAESALKLRNYNFTLKYNTTIATPNFTSMVRLSTSNAFSVDTGFLTSADIPVTFANAPDLFIAPFKMTLKNVAGSNNGSSATKLFFMSRKQSDPSFINKNVIFEAINGQRHDYDVANGNVIPKGDVVLVFIGNTVTGVYGVESLTFQEVL